MPTLEEIRDLERRKEALVAEVKSETLAAIETKIEVLRELGFEYEVVPCAGPKNRSRKKSHSQSGKPTGQCPICDFETVPPHDARHHRSQNPKVPFTEAELSERGFSKVGTPEANNATPIAAEEL